MNIADEIQKLEELRRTGVLTEAEFSKAKALVLSGQPPAPFPVSPLSLRPGPERRIQPPWGCLSGLVIFGVVALIALLTNPTEESLRQTLRSSRTEERSKMDLLDKALDLAVDFDVKRTSYGLFSIATVKPRVRLVGTDLDPGAKVLGFFGRWWIASK